MVTSTEVPLKILQAVKEIVLRDGVQAVRVDRVAAAAGVNKRMIYHYFQDKAGLLQALYQHQLSVLQASGALSAASMGLLGELFHRRIGATGNPVTWSGPVDQDMVSAALQIVLPQLLGGGYRGVGEAGFDSSVPASAAAEFAAFAVEVVGLLFPQLAQPVLGCAPGSAGYAGACKRLLTAQAAAKPVYRMTSSSRVRGAAAAGTSSE